jgi:glycosyltransferase involved in cell wall biosynthesis
LPKVSVILNSFNQAAYVREAVESVLGQTFDDYELILVDNGSTDATPEILRAYERHPKVKLFLHSENVAITRRFNQAVSVASGELISFLYSDDLYLPRKLERQVAAFATKPADYGVVYGPAEGYNVETGRRWRMGSIDASGWVLRSLLLEHEKGQLSMVSPMLRRRCLLENPFYEDVFAEGEGIFFRVALTWRFLYLDEPLVVLRDHLSNAGKAIERNAEITSVWLDRLERHPRLPPDMKDAVRVFRATLLRNQGWQSVRVGGDVHWARSCFAQALRTDWRTAIHPRLVAGVGLSLLGSTTRNKLNRWANTLLRIPGTASYVEDFGGAGGRRRD